MSDTTGLTKKQLKDIEEEFNADVLKIKSEFRKKIEVIRKKMESRKLEEIRKKIN